MFYSWHYYKCTHFQSWFLKNSCMVYQVECDDVYQPGWVLSFKFRLLDRIFKKLLVLLFCSYISWSTLVLNKYKKTPTHQVMSSYPCYHGNRHDDPDFLLCMIIWRSNWIRAFAISTSYNYYKSLHQFFNNIL